MALSGNDTIGGDADITDILSYSIEGTVGRTSNAVTFLSTGSGFDMYEKPGDEDKDNVSILERDEECS